MEALYRLFTFVGTLAIVAALAGVAYFIKWQGESFAAGLLSGIALFCGWYRLEKGRWP